MGSTSPTFACGGLLLRFSLLLLTIWRNLLERAPGREVTPSSQGGVGFSLQRGMLRSSLFFGLPAWMRIATLQRAARLRRSQSSLSFSFPTCLVGRPSSTLIGISTRIAIALSGRGAWDISKHLGADLLLPFLEPLALPLLCSFSGPGAQLRAGG